MTKDAMHPCPGCWRTVDEVPIGRDVPLSCFHDESGRRWHLACGETYLAKLMPNASAVARQRWRLESTVADLLAHDPGLFDGDAS